MKTLPPLITLLLLFLSIHGLLAQCPAQLSLKGVEHGLFVLDDLTPTDPNAHTDVIAFKQYSVLLKSPLSNPKIIVALAQMSTLTSTIDLFDINIIGKTETQFVLGFIYEPMKWKKISYRYLINNRTDLNFQMVTLSSATFKTSNNNFVIAETELEQEIKNFQKYQVLSFIRGLKYKNNELVDHSLAVSIVSGNLTSNKIAFNISGVTSSKKVQLQLLSVSYLYFETKVTSFASFGGLISRNNYVGKSLIDILHADLPTNLYWLYGITTIDFTGNDFRVTSEITEDSFFHLETSLSTKKIDFTYFSIAGKAASVCQNCPDKIISGTVCVKDCLPDEIYYLFKDGSKACQKCTGSLVADAQRKKCVENTSNSGSQTILTKTIASQTTQTSTKLEYQQNQAYTPVNPNNDSSSQTTTSSPSVENKTPIETQQTQPMIKSESEPYLSPGSQTSMTASSLIEEFNYCNALEHSYWTGESCQCKVGFKLEFGSCVALVLLEQSNGPSVIDQTDPLVNINQSNGTYLRGIPDRGSNLDAENTMFVKLVPRTDSLDKKCSSELQVYDQETEHCECKEGLGFKANLDEDVLECVNCSNFSGYYLEEGRCQYCGQNQLYDDKNKECVCREGFVFNSDKDCIAGIGKPDVKTGNETVTTSNQQSVTVSTPTNMTQTGTTSKTTTPTTTTATTTSTNTTTTQASPTRVRDTLSLVNPESQMTLTTQTTTDASSTLTTISPSSTSTETILPEPLPSSTVMTTTVTLPTPTNIPSQSFPTTQTTITPVPTTSPTVVPAPAPSTLSSQCMKLTKTPQINAANIYISLQLSSERSFKSEDEMQNFLKQDFLQQFSKPSSVYCMQSDMSLKEFDCLLLYPTGVPNANFEIRFWYNDGVSGNQCSLKVSVNPLESAAKSLRSLRRRTI